MGVFLCPHCGAELFVVSSAHVCIEQLLASPTGRAVVKEIVREVLCEEKVIHQTRVAGGDFNRVFAQTKKDGQV